MGSKFAAKLLNIFQDFFYIWQGVGRRPDKRIPDVVSPVKYTFVSAWGCQVIPEDVVE